MDLSPQDVGRLLRFAPFAIAVLVALWTRFRTARARQPKRPTSFPAYPTSAGRPSNAAPPSAAATASSRPIEPR